MCSQQLGMRIPQPRSCMTAEGTIREVGELLCKLLNGLEKNTKVAETVKGSTTVGYHSGRYPKSTHAGRSVGGACPDWQSGYPVTVEDTDPASGLYASPP